MKASKALRRGSVLLAGACLLLLLAVPAVADPGADLSVTKTDSPDPVVAGSNITYTIGVTNLGPDEATGVTLSDSTPANTTFVSISSVLGWTCTTPAAGGTGAVSCTSASLISGASASFTMVLNVNPATTSGTVISNTATASSAVADANPANNSVMATTTVSVTSATCTMTGTNGPDSLNGTPGDDVICGGNGGDTINGGGGNDVIVGGNGKDVLNGDAGNDVVMGGNGKDQVTGGMDIDVLRGGNSKDTLIADDLAGGDTLFGGLGQDTCASDLGDVVIDCP